MPKNQSTPLTTIQAIGCACLQVKNSPGPAEAVSKPERRSTQRR